MLDVSSEKKYFASAYCVHCVKYCSSFIPNKNIYPYLVKISVSFRFAFRRNIWVQIRISAKFENPKFWKSLLSPRHSLRVKLPGNEKYHQ